MSAEIKVSLGTTGATLYFQVRNAAGQIWNTASAAFQSYQSANIADYDVAMTEQGTSGFYTGNFPTGITTNGTYDIAAFQQSGGSPAETDAPVAQGSFSWNGSVQLSLADFMVSGAYTNQSFMRGVMVRNYPVYMVQAANGVTPLTSGVLSGQISRDGGAFGALQSGAFTELGNGWYNLQALTSGDLLCNTAALQFTGVGVSGGLALTRNFSIMTQPSSGY